MIPMDAAINKEEVLAYEAKLAQNAASGNRGYADTFFHGLV